MCQFNYIPLCQSIKKYNIDRAVSRPLRAVSAILKSPSNMLSIVKRIQRFEFLLNLAVDGVSLNGDRIEVRGTCAGSDQIHKIFTYERSLEADEKVSIYNYLRLTLIKASWTRSVKVLWPERNSTHSMGRSGGAEAIVVDTHNTASDPIRYECYITSAVGRTDDGGRDNVLVDSVSLKNRRILTEEEAVLVKWREWWIAGGAAGVHQVSE